MKHHILFVLGATIGLGGCAQLPDFLRSAPPPEVSGPDLPTPQANGARPMARPTEAQEVAQEVAQVGPSAASGVLGTTVASLGDATQPGNWLETPLVSVRQTGQVSASTGKTVAVELRPISGPDGAGSRISLAAMLALGLSLTDLPELTVRADG